MSLQNTPSANRLHIAIFGKRNSGKSTLINAITNQSVALVSNQPGTTTDPVFKAMEIAKIGPVMFIDTAGYDDVGELGELRVSQTKKVIDRTDIAILVLSDTDFEDAKQWIKQLKSRKIPIIIAVNDFENNDILGISMLAFKAFDISPIVVNADKKTNIDKIRSEILRLLPTDFEIESITAKLVKKNDVVMLVMPQDIGAPKGRLILPQVQATRDLLDNHCTVISVTADQMQSALDCLKNPPDLIITDSQVFSLVHKIKPEQSRLTSFSILYAAYKGDLDEFVNGANFISKLNNNSNVLIAESCTHAPQTEDIGRIKIPNMLRNRYGENLNIDVVSGNDFPDDLSKYDLIIQCGGCMYSRRYMLSRISRAKNQEVPITNYGVALAYLNGILDDVLI